MSCVQPINLDNPFPGLRAFEPEEEHLFFGREEQVDELMRRLRRTRFLTVVGSSGSGKSSLVRSGLIPALHSGYMVEAGSSWRITVFRPGDDPIGNLAEALVDPEVIGDPEQPPAMLRGILEATLRRGNRGLLEAVRQAKMGKHDNLMLVVDQFEEIFRFKRSANKSAVGDAAAFLKLLLEAAKPDDLRVYIVLTMRSDFLGSCVEFHRLPEAINQGQYLVPRMTRDERRAAIESPVAVAGGEISPRLSLRLLNDVGDNPDQLPILPGQRSHPLSDRWSGGERSVVEHRLSFAPIPAVRHRPHRGGLRPGIDHVWPQCFRRGDLDLDQERPPTSRRGRTHGAPRRGRRW